MDNLWTNLWRRKVVDKDDLSTELRRCLRTIDLTLLGMGHMIGGGIYVLTGTVAKSVAGPAVVISFLLAGVAAILAALCYAELSARAPKAGSAYTYVFMSLGELPAFFIGWQLVMEHLIGAAAVARTWSAYLDALFNYKIGTKLQETFPLYTLENGTVPNMHDIGNGILSPAFDLPALVITILVSMCVAVGVRSSTTFNNSVTCLNLAVIAFIVFYGGSFIQPSNWGIGQQTQGQKEVTFLPYGFHGVVAGASRCFFAYIGFDSIATAAEETKNPSRSLPTATLSAMTVVTISYLLMSSVLTLMVPYYAINAGAAFSSAFDYVNVSWAGNLLAAGAVAGITTALTGHLFTLPRCIYAMADDGLLWRRLAYVNPNTKVPSFTVGLVAIVAGLLAAILNTELLVELLSIGTLSAYTMVSCSVILLRYSPESEEDKEREVGLPKPQFRWLFRCLRVHPCFQTPGRMVNWSITGFLVVASIGSTITVQLWESGIGTVVGLATVALLIIFTIVIMCHEQVDVSQSQSFTMSMVPLLPMTSIIINVLLMANLPLITWLRLLVWMAIGLFIYIFYGYKNSILRQIEDDEMPIIMKQDGVHIDAASRIKLR